MIEKMQDGRKERITENKTHTHTHKQNKPNERKEKMQVKASRIPGRDGISNMPQDKVIAFPLGRACSSQERWLLQCPGIPH